MLLLDYLKDRAEKMADGVVLIADGVSYSYKQLEAYSNKFANALVSMGVRKGDRVSVCMPNSWEYVITWFGVAKAGGVVNPFNVMLKGAEIKYIVNNAGSKILITTPELVGNVMAVKDELPHLERIVLSDSFNKLLEQASDAPPQVDIHGEDNLFVAYSSGTTGMPKGIVHTHRTTTFQWIASAIRLGLTRQDKVITALPLFHVFANVIVLGGVIVARASYIIQARFDAERTLSGISEYGASIMCGVPTMFAYLNALPLNTIRKYNLSSLDLCVAGGSVLSGKIYDEFNSLYGLKVANLYGITETTGSVACDYRYGDRRPGSSGPANPYMTIRIVDFDDNPVPMGEVGEVTARGPSVMKEYWGMPQATEKALAGGYFHSGDLASMDEDGWIYVVDRKDDMIITGGFNIYPAEVEILINTHAKVVQSAVFGVPDDVKGAIGVAAVVLKPGMSATEEEIIEYCRDRMAHYKCPRKVVFRESLPVNAMNKVMRRKLREEYSTLGTSPA